MCCINKCLETIRKLNHFIITFAFDETISNSLELMCFWNNFKTFISRLKYWFCQEIFINHLYIIYNDQYWMLFCSMSYRTVFFKLQVMPLKWVMKSTERRFLNKIKEKRKYHSTLHSSLFQYINQCVLCVCWIAMQKIFLSMSLSQKSFKNISSDSFEKYSAWAY